MLAARNRAEQALRSQECSLSVAAGPTGTSLRRSRNDSEKEAARCRAKAAKHRSESLQDAETRRQQAKAAKHRSESLQDAETRRQQAKAAKH